MQQFLQDQPGGQNLFAFTQKVPARQGRRFESCPRYHSRLGAVFKLLGVLVLAYALYAAVAGEVLAKDGWRGRCVRRADSAGYFWTVVIIYAGLGVALLTVF